MFAVIEGFQIRVSGLFDLFLDVLSKKAEASEKCATRRPRVSIFWVFALKIPNIFYVVCDVLLVEVELFILDFTAILESDFQSKSRSFKVFLFDTNNVQHVIDWDLGKLFYEVLRGLRPGNKFLIDVWTIQVDEVCWFYVGDVVCLLVLEYVVHLVWIKHTIVGYVVSFYLCRIHRRGINSRYAFTKTG